MSIISFKRLGFLVLTWFYCCLGICDVGSNWTCATSGAAWIPRRFHSAIGFDGKLMVCGGEVVYGSGIVTNDVWQSPDGTNWTLVMDGKATKTK